MKYQLKLKSKYLSRIQNLITYELQALDNFDKEREEDIKELEKLQKIVGKAWFNPVDNPNKFERTLIGPGISTVFGGFPDDLVLNKSYTIIWESENRQYILKDFDYKANTFEWDRPLPKH